MRASLRGRVELAARVQQALALPTKKEAEIVVDTVVAALEATLLNNLGTNGFVLKLGTFGKFSVRHKPGILRKIPFTGETIRGLRTQSPSFSTTFATSLSRSGAVRLQRTSNRLKSRGGSIGCTTRKNTSGRLSRRFGAS
jgi:nucleoid DNA-binding protein